MDNPLFFLLLGVAVAWVGSYFYSMLHNQRKVKVLAAWLQASIHILGTKISSRFVGTDRVDATVGEGRGNIYEAAIVIGVQSRQFFRAVLSLARGGRDSITILATLRRPTARGLEFEIFEANGPLPVTVVTAGTSSEPFEISEHPNQPAYKVAYRSLGGREIALRTLTILLDDKFNVRRFSVRPTSPHFMVVLNVNALPQSDSSNLLQLVKTLSDEVAVAPVPATTPAKAERKAKRSNQPVIKTNLSILPRNGAVPAPGIDPGIILPRDTQGKNHPPADLN